MSLIVCLKAKDGIVLAADSRGTIGDPKDKIRHDIIC